jgi:hypothetical protein
LSPRLASTIFPHLPRASLLEFRLLLVTGSTVVAALAALRLFPMALIAAGVFTPLLATVYLVDVDVYEDEPAWALGLTIGWGAAAGAVVGILANAIGPSDADVIQHGAGQYALPNGLALPVLGLALLLIGPLVLLRLPRFNDVLDGVTFGASAGAAFAGAEAIAYGLHVIGGGVRPEAEIAPWVWRLLALGVAIPVLTMCAAGLACAALWLRYRALLRDASALGPLGHPGIALAVAAALVVGGAIGETFLAAGAWLGWLLLLDLVALIALRQAIHRGLLEELREIPIGPAIGCPNCGASTPRHTFCAACGVSLQALPKTSPRPPPVEAVAEA